MQQLLQPNLYDINCENAGCTLLYASAAAARPVRLLAEHKATMNCSDHLGNTSLAIAAQQGDLRIVQLLVPLNLTQSNLIGATPISRPSICGGWFSDAASRSKCSCQQLQGASRSVPQACTCVTQRACINQPDTKAPIAVAQHQQRGEYFDGSWSVVSTGAVAVPIQVVTMS